MSSHNRGSPHGTSRSASAHAMNPLSATHRDDRLHELAFGREEHRVTASAETITAMLGSAPDDRPGHRARGVDRRHDLVPIGHVFAQRYLRDDYDEVAGASILCTDPNVDTNTVADWQVANPAALRSASRAAPVTDRYGGSRTAGSVPAGASEQAAELALGDPRRAARDGDAGWLDAAPGTTARPSRPKPPGIAGASAGSTIHGSSVPAPAARPSPWHEFRLV